MTYLFTKPGCGKCDWVKSHVELEKRPDVHVLSLDGENPEALAMLAYFECVTLAEKKLPILVSDAGEVLTGALQIRNYLETAEG
ncbi:MAG: hypothetical protein AB1473_06380 [Thermodesulfobacteriota bacterium]